MRIKLLIAAEDKNYAEQLSFFLSDKYSDAFEVAVCASPDRLRDICGASRFDVALFDNSLIREADLSLIHMPLLLYSEDCRGPDPPPDVRRIHKHQRISSIAGEILGSYSKLSADGRSPISSMARVTAFWSPAGGTGTTTAALAYCAHKAAGRRQALYLNLESFSSAPLYFSESGKSISAAFEMLETQDGNLQMFLRGILRQDRDSGISYFCPPENFDDMNILSVEDTATLVTACCGISEELVIDLSCACNKRTWQIFELADTIMILSDSAGTPQIKLSQFTAQHNVYERIKSKAVLVANRGALLDNPLPNPPVPLPLITSCDEKDVYKKLAASF